MSAYNQEVQKNNGLIQTATNELNNLAARTLTAQTNLFGKQALARAAAAAETQAAVDFRNQMVKDQIAYYNAYAKVATDAATALGADVFDLSAISDLAGFSSSGIETLVGEWLPLFIAHEAGKDPKTIHELLDVEKKGSKSRSDRQKVFDYVKAAKTAECEMKWTTQNDGGVVSGLDTKFTASVTDQLKCTLPAAPTSEVIDYYWCLNSASGSSVLECSVYSIDATSFKFANDLKRPSRVPTTTT